jgi:hypothetical protein
VNDLLLTARTLFTERYPAADLSRQAKARAAKVMAQGPPPFGTDDERRLRCGGCRGDTV